jgi:carbon-monoxide dehydrogenase medium subunit
MLWNQFFLPSSLAEALRLKAELGAAARFVAGGTDIIIDLDRGRQSRCSLIDISRIPELHFIQVEERGLRIGGAVTHAEVLQSAEVRTRAGVLAQAAIEVGAPQIRNRSTLSGNIVTASPAADTVPPLLALDALVELESVHGRRELPLADFITGFRRVDLADDEVVRSILIPPSQGERRGAFLKLGLRNAQAISVICVAASLEFAEDGRVLKAGIALGSVAPTTIRVPEAEQLLIGQPLDEALISAAALAAQQTAAPISDVRGSAAYRNAMVKVYTGRALRYIRDAKTPPPSADPGIFLQVPGATHHPVEVLPGERSHYPVQLTVNGQPLELESGDTVLLYALRKAGLNGTKEGCLEGECGACTVLLDGKAVDSCLVPAATAQGCDVRTIEGLARADELHPLQQSFINQGGVQCGYCTPGLIVSGSTLLEECPQGANEWQCRSALVGNLCRCTGYAKVLAAMAQAQEVKV